MTHWGNLKINIFLHILKPPKTWTLWFIASSGWWSIFYLGLKIVKNLRCRPNRLLLQWSIHTNTPRQLHVWVVRHNLEIHGPHIFTTADFSSRVNCSSQKLHLARADGPPSLNVEAAELSENGGGLSTTNRREGTLTFGEGQVEAEVGSTNLLLCPFPEKIFM